MHPSQIRRRRKNYAEIKAMAEHSPKKLTIHHGSTSVNQAVEDQVYDWVLAQRMLFYGYKTYGLISKRKFFIIHSEVVDIFLKMVSTMEWKLKMNLIMSNVICDSVKLNL